MECPLIDKRVIESEFNKKINYKDVGGNIDYTFFEHNDGYGNKSKVQFCQRNGRKKDVFECLDENDWKQCRAYLTKY